MSNKEQIFSKLEKMGYSPSYDDEDDIRMMYQLKPIYFLADEERNYVSVMMPQFIELEEDDVNMALLICNKLTRELKLAKAYVDSSFKTVTGTCEFYYTDEESLENSIKESLNVIGILRSMYRKTQKELSEI